MSVIPKATIIAANTEVRCHSGLSLRYSNWQQRNVEESPMGPRKWKLNVPINALFGINELMCLDRKCFKCGVSTIIYVQKVASRPEMFEKYVIDSLKLNRHVLVYIYGSIWYDV